MASSLASLCSARRASAWAAGGAAPVWPGPHPPGIGREGSSSSRCRGPPGLDRRGRGCVASSGGTERGPQGTVLQGHYHHLVDRSAEEINKQNCINHFATDDVYTRKTVKWRTCIHILRHYSRNSYSNFGRRAIFQRVTLVRPRTKGTANNDQAHSFCGFLHKPFIQHLFLWSDQPGT